VVSYTSLGERHYHSPTENERSDDSIKLLLLSKYYPHKNLEVLLDLARLIRERKIPIQFSITIENDEAYEARILLQEIKQQDAGDIIRNIGHVGLNNIANIYLGHDGLFLPTLLESFSGTYIEAMYFDKPIFTSNMDFALEICKDAAFYFNPLDANDIINVIISAFSDPNVIAKKVKLGKEYILGYQQQNDVYKSLNINIKRLINISDE